MKKKRKYGGMKKIGSGKKMFGRLGGFSIESIQKKAFNPFTVLALVGGIWLGRKFY